MYTIGDDLQINFICFMATPSYFIKNLSISITVADHVIGVQETGTLVRCGRCHTKRQVRLSQG